MHLYLHKHVGFFLIIRREMEGRAHLIIEMKVGHSFLVNFVIILFFEKIRMRSWNLTK
jgi:hypothetical protein